MEGRTDPLFEERTAYLAASQASMDATLDAAAIQSELATADQAKRFLAALQRMVELQTATLAAHDRVVIRADELGVDWRVIATFREGRADLALGLQETLAQVQRVEARLTRD